MMPPLVLPACPKMADIRPKFGVQPRNPGPDLKFKRNAGRAAGMPAENFLFLRIFKSILISGSPVHGRPAG
jgi:hypothetical protein